MSPADGGAELRELCARRDIERLLATYTRGLDRLMPELLRSVFHEDAFYDCGTYTGDVDGFVRFATGFLAEMQHSHHQLGQRLIEVAGNHASGEVYFTAFHRTLSDGKDTDLFMAGRYVDEYEDRGGGWKIAKRRLLIDWVRAEPAADGFVKATPALLCGARGDKDFSNTRNWPA